MREQVQEMIYLGNISHLDISKLAQVYRVPICLQISCSLYHLIFCYFLMIDPLLFIYLFKIVGHALQHVGS